MSEQQTAVKKLIQYLFFAISCFIGLLLFYRFILMGFNQMDSQSVTIEEGWNIQINGEKFPDTNLSTLSFPATGIGDVIILENYLPLVPWEYPVIRVDAWYCIIDLFIDNQPVFSYGHDLVARRKSVGTGYHLVHPDEYVPGSELRIVLQVTEPQAFSKLQPVCIDKAGTTVLELWKSRGFAFGSSLFFIIIGTLLIILAIIWTARDRRNFRLMLVGLSCLFLGLISFYDNDCAVLFIRNYTFNTWANHMVLYGCNISLMHLVYSTMTERYLDRLVIKAFMIFFLVYTGLMICLDACDIIHLVATRSILMTLLFLEVVVAIIVCLLNILSNSKQYRIPSIGFLFMIGFIGLDLLRYNVVKRLELDTTSFNGTMVCMGGMVFLISVFVNFYKEYSAGSKKKAEETVLKQYHSLDYDTGLLAASARPEIMSILSNMGMQQYTDITITLDIDDYVRTQSPIVIENMIWAFSQTLLRSFPSSAYIFRMADCTFEVIMDVKRDVLDTALFRLSKEAIKARQPNMTENYDYGVDIQMKEMPKAIC